MALRGKTDRPEQAVKRAPQRIVVGDDMDGGCFAHGSAIPPPAGAVRRRF